MRITSQMLSESAQKAGVEIKHSLLDYIGSDNKGNTLQQVLSSTKSSQTDAANEKTYKKLGGYAEALTDNIEKLMDDGETSLIGKLAASDSEEDRAALVEEIGDLADNFNNTRSALIKAQGTLNTYYAKLMKEDAEEYGEQLETVGITVSGSGLSVDEAALKTATYEEIKAAFGTDSSFMKKLSKLANHISDSAEANLESLSSQYNSSGVNRYTLSSKYDTKG